MTDFLFQIDKTVFAWINQTLTHPWLDVFFVNLTDLHKTPAFVAAAAICLLFFSVRKYRYRAWRPFLGVILAVAIADIVSYRVMKKFIERPRPFQSESMENVRKLTDAHGNSFPSNHAANCTAAALILGLCFPRRRYFFYIFAALVGYSRIYLGVHYPSDVLGGVVVGLMAGYCAAPFALNQFKPWSKSLL